MKISRSAKPTVDAIKISNIIPVILIRGWLKGCQPDGGYAQIFQIVKSAGESPKISSAVSVTILKGFYVEVINDGICIPTGSCDRLIFLRLLILFLMTAKDR